VSLKDIQQLAIDVLAKLPFESLKDVLKNLLNVIEEQTSEVKTLKEENQRYKDEINRLKGEKGKPVIKPPVKPNHQAPDGDEHKKESKPRHTGLKCSKLKKLKATRTETIPIDRNKLPADAVSNSTRPTPFPLLVEMIRARPLQPMNIAA